MLVQNGMRVVTWASDPHIARFPWTPGLASPANPRRSASAASSRMVERLVGVPITDRAGRRSSIQPATVTRPPPLPSNPPRVFLTAVSRPEADEVLSETGERLPSPCARRGRASPLGLGGQKE